MPGDNNGWNEYKQRVMFQLDSITDSLDTLTKQLISMQTEIAVLKTKAALWGALVAFAVSTLVQIAMHLWK